MKFLITGDLHLRTRRPQSRMDEYFVETCQNKLRQILEIYMKQECDVLIQPGDFFDSPNPSGELVVWAINQLIYMIRRCKHKNRSFCLVTVHGQHDLSYHSEKSIRRSILSILEAANTINCLREEKHDYGLALFIGASFGQTPPLAPEFPKSRFENNLGHTLSKVLVAHTMVGDKPLWPGHDLTEPEQYVKKHPGYDLYVLGDYHYPFSKKVDNAWVINAGCMLRLTSSERDRQHRPKVVVFDTEVGEPVDIYLDVEPASEVFDMTKIEEKAKDGLSFEGFIDRLKDTGSIGVNFRENLVAYFEQNKTDKNVKKLVWDTFGGV